MNEIERRDAATGEPTMSSQAAASLVEWAQAAQAAHNLAVSLTKSAFVPDKFRGKEIDATAAILSGSELGLSPLASLNAFHNIAGTWTPKAATLVAVAQSRGHHVDVVEEDDEHATVRYRRKGEREWRTVTYTVADAQRAGLPGRNPSWRSQPRAMCVARAQSIAARRVAADALLSMPYSAEEMQDATPTPVRSERVTVAELEEPQRPIAPKPQVTPEEPIEDWPEVTGPPQDDVP